MAISKSPLSLQKQFLTEKQFVREGKGVSYQEKQQAISKTKKWQ